MLMLLFCVRISDNRKEHNCSKTNICIRNVVSGVSWESSVACFDATQKKWYYHNSVLGKTQWEMPVEHHIAMSIIAISLSFSKLCVACITFQFFWSIVGSVSNCR